VSRKEAPTCGTGSETTSEIAFITQARQAMRYYVGLLMSLVILAGCEQRSRVPDNTARSIPPESAKEAIILLLRNPETKKHCPPGTAELFEYLHTDDYLTTLENSPIVINQDDKDDIAVDAWVCDLAQLQFRSAYSDNAHRHLIRGSFFRDGQGKWKGKITGVTIQPLSK
jgi:hypothetical protein